MNPEDIQLQDEDYDWIYEVAQGALKRAMHFERKASELDMDNTLLRIELRKYKALYKRAVMADNSP